jgi:hypothetical protein
MDGKRVLAMAGAEAIGSGIAAADDDDALAGGEDLVRDGVALVAAVLLREELHRVMDALELAAGDLEIARVLGAAGEKDGVEIAPQVGDGDVHADVGVDLELHSFGAHLLEAAVDEVLLHLEVRDAVAEEAADAVALLEDGDGVAGAGELLGSGEPGGSGADDGDAFAGADGRRLGADVALVEGAVGDRLLDELDGDGRLIDAEDARGLARRRTDAAREFGEIVGRVELADGLAPLAVEDEVVPIGDQVGERAAGMAEGHAAIHAAGALGLDALDGERLIDLEPVVDALPRVAAGGELAGVLEEAGDFTHERAPSSTRRRGERGENAEKTANS